MKFDISFLIVIFITIVSCKTIQKDGRKYASEQLVIQKIDKNCYIHTSYLETDKFGKVPCNGMIYINNNEAIIFDTPTTDSGSKELLKYVEGTLNSKVKFVVINHFHVDCLGGLKEFHEREIVSYSNEMTIMTLAERNEVLPMNGFKARNELKVGNEMVINEYFGEGHTKDNIVSYIPSNKILFGGCLVKSLKSGKGNLNDANTDQWSETVIRIKKKYPDINIVVPGHGKFGGIELLDYTINMFLKKNE